MMRTLRRHLHLYAGPGLTANIDYQRFPHQLETTNTYPGFLSSSQTGSGNYFSSNYSAGQDYAINVEEIKADFKGNLTDNGMFKWRLNVFCMEKEGDRQADALTHAFESAEFPGCSAANTSPLSVYRCHVDTQSQHIDWKTTQVEPAIEACLAPWLTVEYSRTMRTFAQDDQMVTNDYPAAPNLGFGGTAGYDVVPDSISQTDRLKVHAQMGDATDVYVLSYVGDNKNELDLTNMHFGGVDARISNHAIDGWKLTAYGKVYSENTEIQTQALNTLYPELASFYQDPSSVLTGLAIPVNRDETTMGVDARWTPFCDEHGTVRGGLAFTAGYEYGQIRRTYADYSIAISSSVTDLFEQPDSDINTFLAGVEEKWSPCFSSYVRYKYIATAYPLYGVTPSEAGGSVTLDNALDTCLPTRQNRIEIGSTWSPGNCFMINGTFYVEDSSNHGPYAYFDSTSYPFIFTAMYAVTPQWTINGGYANFVNAINQNITLGGGSNLFTAPWRYLGSANVFNIGTSYSCTRQWKLTANFEYVRGLDSITSTPAPPGAVTPFDLGSYSLVSTDTYQISAGFDYLWRPRITTYFRYNYYDFGDLATGLTSGKLSMFLGGMSAYF